mmetsp:Transcript_22767/g.49486  ORF Transcript_22767/g.49486 Transcript_22767/m.49486 type:complete len:407 (-) Transcript_22767:78-1298(-)
MVAWASSLLLEAVYAAMASTTSHHRNVTSQAHHRSIITIVPLATRHWQLAWPWPVGATVTLSSRVLPSVRATTRQRGPHGHGEGLGRGGAGELVDVAVGTVDAEAIAALGVQDVEDVRERLATLDGVLVRSGGDGERVVHEEHSTLRTDVLERESDALAVGRDRRGDVEVVVEGASETSAGLLRGQRLLGGNHGHRELIALPLGLVDVPLGGRQLGPGEVGLGEVEGREEIAGDGPTPRGDVGAGDIETLLHKLDHARVVGDLGVRVGTTSPGRNEEEGDTETQPIDVAGGHIADFISGDFAGSVDGRLAIVGSSGRGGGPVVVKELTSLVVVEDEGGLGVDVTVLLVAEDREETGREILPVGRMVGGVLRLVCGADDPRNLGQAVVADGGSELVDELSGADADET